LSRTKTSFFFESHSRGRGDDSLQRKGGNRLFYKGSILSESSAAAQGEEKKENVSFNSKKKGGEKGRGRSPHFGREEDQFLKRGSER